MPRYIDADILRKNEIARCHCVPCVGSNDNNEKDLDEVLNDCPDADVVPKSKVESIFDELIKQAGEIAENYKKEADGMSVGEFARIEYRGTQIGALLVQYKIAELKKKYTEGEDKPAASEEKYFSPEDVRKMTNQEVREKYTAIRKSMERW